LEATLSPPKTPRLRINKVFRQLQDLPQRYVACYGGRRSSKSYSVSQLLFLKAMSYRRRILIMRKVAVTMRMSVWARMMDVLTEAGVLDRCRVNKSEKEIELPNGSMFLFVGADDPEKLKSLEQITDIWMEEANEFDEIDFNTLDAGMSTDCQPRPQFFFTFNPIPTIQNAEHWLQRRFLNKVPHELGKLATEGDVAVLRTYYKNNYFCPVETAHLLESYRESNYDLYRLWALGEFTKLKGAILERWDIVDGVPDGVPMVGYGLDFGFADDPAFVVKAWRQKDEVWLKEVICASGLTNQELSTTMDSEGMVRHRDLVVADSAEPKSIKELRELGWQVKGADKSRDGKHAAAQFLRGLVIHLLKGSTELIAEFGTWCWQSDRRTQKLLPVPVDGNDHGIDATIYLLFNPATPWGAL